MNSSVKIHLLFLCCDVSQPIRMFSHTIELLIADHYLATSEFPPF